MITRDEYINLVKNEYGDLTDEIILGLSEKRTNAIRINTLKISVEEALAELDKNNITYQKSDISNFSYLTTSSNKDLMELDLFKSGRIYLQSI